MTTTTTSKPDSAGGIGLRSGLVAALLVVWTVLAGLAVWGLIANAEAASNSVIRFGADEVKTGSERWRDAVALARLNFPWALAWLLLAPYVLWIGLRFSFERSFWVRRTLVLLFAGAAFIGASQTLSKHLAAGQSVMVVVNYSAHADGGANPEWVSKFEGLFTHGGLTNRFVTNRVTKVLVSGEASPATATLEQEFSTETFLTALGTNLPQLLTHAGPPALPPPRSLRSGQWSAGLDGLAYVALLGLAHAGVFHRRYREREKQTAILESRLNEARLHALQAQLQPHFLFNTLNGIATLLRRDPVAAEEMLTSLSDLLRIALGSSHRQEIPLREELDFLDRYLAIQRMRFGDRLESQEEIDPAALDCLVPALLLQPLVENAIRHGLEPSGRPGWVRVTATRVGAQLNLLVEDNGVGLSAEKQRSQGAGVGLANVRERLVALHGDAQALQLEARPEGGVRVKICMPARLAAVAKELARA